MKLTATVPVSKEFLDKLTEADIKWLEQEVSARIKERLEQWLELMRNGPANV